MLLEVQIGGAAKRSLGKNVQIQSVALGGRLWGSGNHSLQ